MLFLLHCLFVIFLEYVANNENEIQVELTRERKRENNFVDKNLLYENKKEKRRKKACKEYFLREILL